MVWLVTHQRTKVVPGIYLNKEDVIKKFLDEHPTVDEADIIGVFDEEM